MPLMFLQGIVSGMSLLRFAVALNKAFAHPVELDPLFLIERSTPPP